MKFRLRHIVLALLFLSPLTINLSPLKAQINTDRILSIGRNALYFDDYVLSIQYFNQVIKLKPYLAEPYLLRAIAKTQLSDYQGALRDCNHCIELNPFQPGAYYTRGYLYSQLGELEKAEQDFTEALVYAPGNKTYLLLRADIRAREKRYDLALEDINYLLRREPHAPTLLYEKGIICLQQADTLCALNHLTETVKYDTQNPSNWSALGLVNLMLENEAEALQNLNQAINLGSKWAGDYINRGIIYYRNHNFRGALADYDKAVSLSPRDAQCYYNRGILRQELGDWNNALEDFNRAIELTPDKNEYYYQRGTVLLQLRQWAEAARDFDRLIEAYPYFLPSYYLAAQAKTALGEKKAAFLYREKAEEMEKKKQQADFSAKDEAPDTDVQTADAQPKRDRRKEFSSRTAQNPNDTGDDDKPYLSTTRGSIQRKYQDAANTPNIVLSYYAQQDPLRRTRYYHLLIDDYNRLNVLPAPLRLTAQEVTLTAEMVNLHFERIAALNDLLDKYEGADLHFARAIELALVQDYASAIDDCTQAIKLRPDFILAYFCRANWRYKLVEYQSSTNATATEVAIDYEMMMRDYDYIIHEQPDFVFAYYNKANVLCMKGDFEAAIPYYTRSVELDSEFAEAWFNRGLTRIYLGDTENGLNDLSRAGELGIYQAYNLITRFR